MTVLLTVGAAVVVGVPINKRAKMNSLQIITVLLIVFVGLGVLTNLLRGIV
ncbi:MAG: hypothetical protein V3R32_05525 [Nitrosomonadaceae bacterium]